MKRDILPTLLLSGLWALQGCSDHLGDARVAEIKTSKWDAHILQEMRDGWRADVNHYELSARQRRVRTAMEHADDVSHYAFLAMQRRVQSAIGTNPNNLNAMIDLFACPPPPGSQDFARQLQEVILHDCDKTRNRRGLVRMLSLSCPPLFGFVAIEVWLVHSRTLDDPVLILMDAYVASVDQANKKVICDRLRQAFVNAEIEEKDDSKFVEGCRAWYIRNKGRIAVNRWYDLLPVATSGEENGKTIERGLYIVIQK